MRSESGASVSRRPRQVSSSSVLISEDTLDYSSEASLGSILSSLGLLGQLLLGLLELGVLLALVSGLHQSGDGIGELGAMFCQSAIFSRSKAG